MSEHTPGPWEVYRDYESDRRHIIEAGSLSYPQARITRANWIAEIDPDATNHSNEETDANAEFIVRACNNFDALLAECRATATMLRVSSIADHPWAAERIAALDAAVALATKGMA